MRSSRAGAREVRSRQLPALLSLTAIVAGVYLAGGMDWAERHLMDLRFALLQRPATGGVVVVAIDPRSIERIDTWPWPRGYHATVLDNLIAAGARQVAFDVDFSSRSDPDEDRALEQALRAAGGRAVLPVFSQWQPGPGGAYRLVMTSPLPSLAAAATLASINVAPDADGLVRRYAAVPPGIDGPPALARVLAGSVSAPGDPFYIDFGIDPASIPVVSYADVLTGAFDRGIVRGRDVIVGATALELGDQAAVPLRTTMPGPMLQALAAESIASGRTLARAPSWLAVSLLLAIALAGGLPMQRLSWRGGVALLLGSSGLLFVGALACQRVSTLMLDVAPGWSVLGCAYGLALMRRIDQQEIKVWLASLRARHTELRMRHVVENCSEAILTLDAEGRIETFNLAAERLFGRRAADAVGCVLTDLVSGASARSGGTLSRMDAARVVRPDGEVRLVDLAVSSFTMDGRVVRVAFLQDVTESLRQRDQLRHQATHDALTDLPNRAMLFDRMRHDLDGDGPSEGGALLMLDLDRFKEINDTLGHATGDRLLCGIAERLREGLEPGQMIARLGGDEFAVLLPRAGPAEATARARRLIEAIASPFPVEGMTLQVDVSVGIALSPLHGDDPGLLLQRADVAMYVAKKQRNTFALYDPEADANSLRHLTMKGEMRDSIERDQFELHYQPKLDLVTDRVVGAEALLRWRHPRHGPLPPGEFIPLAERTGLIKPLTQWVLTRALAQTKAWDAKGLHLSMSVNCSARNLLEEDLPETLSGLLTASGVDPGRLVLEITETAIIEEPGRSLRVLKRLAALGVKVSIDDFGTAYSSLDYLRKLPATELKIDRSFVARMDRDAGDATIVRSTIRLARDFGLETVAEGIESQAVLDMLREIGCEQGQGHFISPPLPADRFELWLSARAITLAAPSAAEAIARS